MAACIRAVGAHLLIASALFVTALPASSSQAASRRWQFEEPTQAIPQAVSIGNAGTQVFAAIGGFSGRARLLSSHDTDPALPIWEHTTQSEVRNVRVSSSEQGHVHASLHMAPDPLSPGNWKALVRGYHSSSQQPAWQWTFPASFWLNDNATVHVSADGTRVVASLFLFASSQSHVVAFDAQSGAKVRDFMVPSFGGYKYTQLSGDGSTLYLANTGKSYVVDVQGSGMFGTFTTFIAVLEGHALSFDGKRAFAGAYNTVRGYTRNASGGYTLDTNLDIGGVEGFCHRLALSQDGRVLAAAFVLNSNVRDVRVVAWNLQTGAKVTDHLMVGGGSFSNKVTGLSIAADGSRFAVGCWGDQAGLLPGLALIEPGTGGPYATFPMPGSVMGLDMSSNGDWVALATKSIHANQAGSGGGVELYSTRLRDLQVNGIPSLAGPPVEIRMRPSSGPHVFVLSNLYAEQPPLSFAAGELHVGRQGIGLTPLSNLGGGQFGTDWTFAPHLGHQVGQTVYFQGFSSSPRKLTTDWVGVTVLP